MSIADRARPEIRRLAPYQAAVQVDDTIRLNANESPWTSGADSFHRPLNRYPEIRPARLRDTLARRFGCRSEQLLVTRGTSEAIDLLIRVFCGDGRDNIVTTAPTFSMYRHYATIQGAGVRELMTDRDKDFSVSADSVIEQCDDNTRLVFLCSPNNPTGTSIDRQTIRTILTQLSGQSAVVVDEAYVEFSSRSSTVDLLSEFDNLVVLRTLSKALAFAGARCGAVIGPPDVVNMLDAVQAPYAIATPVVECVEKALSGEWLEEATSRIQELLGERSRISEALAQMPFVERQWPSDANFILIEVRDAQGLMDYARDNRLLLRYFGPPLSDCVRITIGSSEENDGLLRVLRDFGANHG